MSRLCLSVATVLVAIAPAQVITIPNGTVAAEGNSLNLMPWGWAAAGGLQFQCLYDSSNLTLQGVAAPVLITRLRWRANTAATTTTWTGGTYSTATVRMSTSATDAMAPSATFASNHGPDLTTVYAGPVTYVAGAGLGIGVPGMTVVDLTLQRPFVYDPAAGDLSIDCDFADGTWGVGTVNQLDVQAMGSLSSRVETTTHGWPIGSITTNHGVVVTLDCAPVPSALATAAAYGTGCYLGAASFYEDFPTAAAFDLGNSAMTMVYLGTGYTIVPGIAAYVPPTAAATTLAMADNAQVAVALASPLPVAGGSASSLVICSNGFVSVASGNGVWYTPSVETFLNAPQTAWWCWHDYNPSVFGGGRVKFQEVGLTSYVTWDGVFDLVGPRVGGASTFQLQFDRSSGNVTFAWQAMSAAGTGYLVGYSPGGPSPDPGNRDLSVAVTAGFALPHADTLPLTLVAGSRPILNTSVALVTTRIPAGSPFAATMISTGQLAPGLDLGFLGAPGCLQQVTPGPDILFLGPASSTVLNLPIPNVAGFLGMLVYCQAASVSPGVNPLGVLTSNGVRLLLGNG
ncbi:MAG: hypothetical protein IPK26_10775 [Planctomycetes bacterium]|nr:hypothetical protein [Planctomycetota bacterium]